MRFENLSEMDVARLERFPRSAGRCPQCAAVTEGEYSRDNDGVYLTQSCPEHGDFREQVERDAGLFDAVFRAPHRKGPRHLVLPVTYSCNMACPYCYTSSNEAGTAYPADRTPGEIGRLLEGYRGNVTLIGGEPTVRQDLPELVSIIKSERGRRASVASNGLRLADREYLMHLRTVGLDFVFLAVNHPEYEPDRRTYDRKMEALGNCAALGLPVWLQRTVRHAGQLDGLREVVREFSETIFKVSVRSLTEFGPVRPGPFAFVSEMLDAVGASSWSPGTNPFNVFIDFEGKPAKVCSWVNDSSSYEGLDSEYVTAGGEWVDLHQGIRIDEVMLRSMRPAPAPAAAPPMTVSPVA